jgi:hypothetical protein
MPWLAVPFKDDQLRSVLSRKFNVSGSWVDSSADSAAAATAMAAGCSAWWCRVQPAADRRMLTFFGR